MPDRKAQKIWIKRKLDEEFSGTDYHVPSEYIMETSEASPHDTEDFVIVTRNIVQYNRIKAFCAYLETCSIIKIHVMFI